MAIEFRCTGCHKLLRVAEETAGKKARCPECGAILNIPQIDEPEVFADVFPEVEAAPNAPGGNPFATAAMDSGNPFQSPLAEDAGQFSGGARYSDQRLAGRMPRLAAVILDGLLNLAVMVPFLAVMIGTMVSSNGLDPQGTALVILIVTGVLSGIGLLALNIYQWYLISTRGQSLGKKWLGVRILLEDEHTSPGFVKGVLLRMWVPAVIGGIPLIGPLFGIVDPLMIFGEERRTLHDLIAGTIVVEA